uniref:Uncharacterized protein n=1 Tax=Tetranychus urticae TaxID=32264 RepID=T1KY22_TETUR
MKLKQDEDNRLSKQLCNLDSILKGKRYLTLCLS